jgi:myotubularin-related protein 1/2
MVPTYPQYLVVPSAIGGEELKQSIKHRSKNRFPAITYRHFKTGAVLTRSAQPLVGLSQHSSAADALLLNLYRVKGITSEYVVFLIIVISFKSIYTR